MKINKATLALFTLVITNSSVLATKHFVLNGDDSGNYSLRNKIEIANPGDTIYFAPGVDTVKLVSDQLLLHKSLYIKGNSNQTVIQRDPANGTPEFRIFHFANCGDVQLENLVITNGQAPLELGVYPQHGGGLCITDTNCNIKIIKCSIIDCNSASGTGLVNPIYPQKGGCGGGIYNAGKLLIIGCTINNNRAGNGGAYFLTKNGDDIEDNIDFPGGDGGGIYNAYHLELINSNILGNSAGNCFYVGAPYLSPSNGGYGGGLYTIAGSYSHISNCLIHNNSTGKGTEIANSVYFSIGPPGYGGGITNCGTIHIENSTLTRNKLQYTYGTDEYGHTKLYVGIGGGLYLSATSISSFNNSIISSNFRKRPTYNEIDDINTNQDSIFMNFSLVGVPNPQNISGIGNLIASDPGFISNEDFHLAFNSPCINAGDPDTTGLPMYDLDGNIRVIENRVDMGAYEFQGYSPDGFASAPGNIFIFPNPFHDRFTIFIPENLRNTVTDAAVHTLSGQIVFETTFNSRSADQNVELPSLPKGIYLLVIRNTKACTIHKIIKL